MKYKNGITGLKSILTLSLITLLSGGVAVAKSETKSETNTKSETLLTAANKAKASCDSDIKKLCGDVTPGEGRIVACLESKEDKLSSSCNSARVDLAGKISKKLDKAEVSFRKHCGTDVQKFCSDIPSGRGRLLDCLGKHQDALSNSCKDLEAKIEKRLDEYLG